MQRVLIILCFICNLGIKYMSFVVLFEISVVGFFTFPLLFSLAVAVLRPVLLIGLRGTRTYSTDSWARPPRTPSTHGLFDIHFSSNI